MTTPNFTPDVPQWCRDAAKECDEWWNYTKDCRVRHMAEVIARHAPRPEATPAPAASDAGEVQATTPKPEKPKTVLKKEGESFRPVEQQQASGVERFTLHPGGLVQEPSGKWMCYADHDAAIVRQRDLLKAKEQYIAELESLCRSRRDALLQVGEERAAEWKRAEAAEAKCAELELSVKSMKGHVSNVEATNEEQGEQLLAKIDQLAAANERIKALEAKLHSKTYIPCECGVLRERVAVLEKERDGLREALREVLKHLGHNQCEHPSTVRKGTIWTCCEDCGMEWADDRGGFKPYVEPVWLTKAYAALAKPSAEVGE